MSMDDLKGKKILVIGGNVHEVIDGVRHYANHARPENHGANAADYLRGLGADVTLIDRDANGKSFANTQQLLNALQDAAQVREYDAVLNLANIPAVKPAHITDKKLKVKKEAGALVPMEVLGNVDIIGKLMRIFPDSPICGYNQQQSWCDTQDSELNGPLAQVAAAANTPDVQAQSAPLPTIRAGGKLSGRRIVITSGPTAEPISDHGDVITNFSSGKQGHAIAQSLAAMGAQVVLVSGPTHIPDPQHPNISVIHTDSARNMRDAVLAQMPADAYVGVAAVADFGMENPGSLHLSPDAPHTLQFSQNPDILQSVGTHESLRPPVVIGFAAETHDLLTYARGKLEKKGADAICANQVGSAIAQRGSDNNQITWVTAQGNEQWEVMTKNDIGKRIGEKIALLLQRSRAGGTATQQNGNFGIV